MKSCDYVIFCDWHLSPSIMFSGSILLLLVSVLYLFYCWIIIHSHLILELIWLYLALPFWHFVFFLYILFTLLFLLYCFLLSLWLSYTVMEKEMATHSSTLAWKIPWMEEPGGLQSMGSQRVGHDWGTSLTLYCNIWIPLMICYAYYCVIFLVITPKFNIYLITHKTLNSFQRDSTLSPVMKTNPFGKHVPN